MNNIFKIIYNEIANIIRQNKQIIALLVLLLAISIIYDFVNIESLCHDSIVDMSLPIKECDDGGKLKFISNQWVCSCEK